MEENNTGLGFLANGYQTGFVSTTRFKLHHKNGGKTSMQVPLQITFRGIPHSDAVETAIRERAAKLDEFFPRIISCRVTVEADHHHHHKGNLYHVHIDLGVPNKDIVVSRDQHDNLAHTDIYVVIRDAFDAAKRQLQEYARVQRGEVKNREAPPASEAQE
jgi:ribosome-associated translation inhibitor RaiA